MALREVLQFPDKQLREKSKPIAEISDEVRELAEDMLDVMYDEPGIGLAAPQVGESIRLIVVDTEERKHTVLAPDKIKTVVAEAFTQRLGKLVSKAIDTLAHLF